MSKQEWITTVHVRLGCEGRPDHALFRKLESLFLRGFSVEEAVNHIKAEAK